MNDQQTIRQRAGTIAENSIRLDVERAEQVVEALNVDLAGSYVIYHQLKKHRWNVAGAEYHDLRRFFGASARETERNADELAQRIRTLGGVPVSAPGTVESHSPIPFEGEDVYDVRTSLRADLEAYGDLIESVSGHVERSESLGDHATGDLLRGQLLELERRASEIDALLGHDSLTGW